MDLAGLFAWAGGGLGTAVALFGAWILLTGRAPAGTARAFRSTTDAGMYSLCTGTAVVLLAVPSRFQQIGFAWQLVFLALAMLLGAIGFLKYRPRRAAGDQAER